MMIGDFNKIVSKSEKFGGREIWRKRLFFREFLQNLGAIDLCFCGSRFTWENNHEWASLIKEQLDRVVASATWMEQNQETTFTHLRKEESDHFPILLTT